MVPRLKWNASTDSGQRAARIVSLHALASVSVARAHVRKKDPDSIHDLRVELRRLRSWVHLYRSSLDDTLRKRTRRRLKRIASATTELRDIDVQIAWLTSECATLGADRLEAGRWMITVLERDRKRAWRAFTKVADRDFERVIRDLEKEFGHYVLTRDVRTSDDEVRMVASTERVLREQARSLRESLLRIRSADDTRRLHRARITAKRLRYALEVLAIQAPSLSAVAEELHRFQDVVGELRDAQLLAHHVSNEITSLAAERTAIVASELVYQPSGPMDFVRVVAEPPFDASLSLLFARLHDRIAAAAREVTLALRPSTTERLVERVENAGRALRTTQTVREGLA